MADAKLQKMQSEELFGDVISPKTFRFVQPRPPRHQVNLAALMLQTMLESLTYEFFFLAVTAWAVILSIVESLPKYHFSLFLEQEIPISILFTIDLVLRLAAYSPKRNIKDIYIYFDIVIVVLCWVSIARSNSEDFRFLRVIRIIRILHLMQLPHFRKDIETLVYGVFLAWKAILLLFVITIIYMFVFGTLGYYADLTGSYYALNPAEGIDRWLYSENIPSLFITPGFPSRWQSIPQVMWFACVTFFTQGYGDTFPVTNLGRLVFWFGIVASGILIVVPMGLFGEKMSQSFTRSTAVNLRKVHLAIHDEKDYAARVQVINDYLDRVAERAREFSRLANATEATVESCRAHLELLQNP